MRKLSVPVLLVALAAAAAASPVTLTLSPVLVYHQYQQTTNNPCVIADTSCQSPSDWTYTVFPAGGSEMSYNETSLSYSVSQITGIVGSTSFLIGLDVNQANGGNTQTLSFFGMYVNGNLVAQYNPSSPTPVPPTTGGGNGNGYADYVLEGFDLSAFQPTDTVYFHVTMPLVNDGREQFFLISTASPPPPPPPEIPEPATSALIGAGLIGLGLLSRRFRKQE